MTTLYSADDLRAVLPHRHPFVMLDRLEVTEPGKSGIGYKNISIADPVFAGHFPQQAIYPGVLLIEAAGHTCGIVHTAAEAEGESRIGFLAGVRKFSFKKVVVPGDVVTIQVRKRTALGDLFEYECKLLVDGGIVAEGSVAVAMQA